MLVVNLDANLSSSSQKNSVFSATWKKGKKKFPNPTFPNYKAITKCPNFPNQKGIRNWQKNTNFSVSKSLDKVKALLLLFFPEILRLHSTNHHILWDFTTMFACHLEYWAKVTRKDTSHHIRNSSIIHWKLDLCQLTYLFPTISHLIKVVFFSKISSCTGVIKRWQVCFQNQKVNIFHAILTEKEILLLDLILDSQLGFLVIDFDSVLIFWWPVVAVGVLGTQAWCVVTYWLHVCESTRLSKGNFPVKEEKRKEALTHVSWASIAFSFHMWTTTRTTRGGQAPSIGRRYR